MIKDSEFNRLLRSIIYPFIFVSIIWLVHLITLVFGYDLVSLGIYPGTITGLRGILFSPLIHSGFSHLISNTFPLLILGTMMFYFYGQLGIWVSMLGWVISGIWIWVFATGGYHIGASSIIYVWAAFLFTSGIIRRQAQLMAISLLVVFIYGGAVWGILPANGHVSWEGHLMGMIAGIVLAVFFRNDNVSHTIFDNDDPDHDDPDELSNEDDTAYWKSDEYDDVRNSEPK